MKMLKNRTGSGDAWVFWAVPAAVMLTGYLLSIFMAQRSAPLPTNWTTDYTTAVRAAAESRKNLLVAFHLEGCPPCRTMERTVLSSEPVRRAQQDFLSVRVDAAAHPELARRLGVIATPTYVILDPQEKILAQAEGLQSVGEFVNFLNLSRNTIAPDQYRE